MDAGVKSQRSGDRCAPKVSPTGRTRQPPGGRHRSVARRDHSLLGERGPLVEQITRMVASTHPASDEINVVPIAPLLGVTDTANNAPYLEIFAGLLHFSLLPDSYKPRNSACWGCDA